MGRDKPGSKSEVKLTEKEIEDLCDEWEPEPLVPPLTDFQKSELEKISVTTSSPAGPKVKLADGKERLNLASFNFMGLMNRNSIKEKAIDALRKYGVGSCGPPGFYGTLDCHMELEASIAEFLGVENSIIYSQGFSTIASVIPAFSKKGDILVVDDGVGMGVLKGMELSRSIVKFFKHNDMQDLERVLSKIQLDADKKKSPLTRRFIVVEGLYTNYGDLCDLPTVVALKNKYRYRAILEDSMGFGVIGKTGRGTHEHFGIPATDVDMIVASMANSLCSSGGFCAGSKQIVEHQRLSGLAYTFSASLPAILAVSALESLRVIEAYPELSILARENAQTLRAGILRGGLQGMVIFGDEASPFFHIRLRARLSDREEEEKVLQDIVDAATKDGVLITRAKYVIGQELYLPLPSLRITACAAHTKKEVEKAAGVIKEAIKKTLKIYRISY